jgi:short-subunit dehydrogenase involved in D-alanine esterification of teichoic acids
LPGFNVVINNAGIQRRVSLASDTAPWSERQAEIDILLAAPVHLNHLLIPLMLRSKQPALIVNVTSGGAFVPQVFAPVYSACKAALHSYTVTPRHALQGTWLRVVELVPPAVQTGLGDPGATHPKWSDLVRLTRRSFETCWKPPSRSSRRALRASRWRHIRKAGEVLRISRPVAVISLRGQVVGRNPVKVLNQQLAIPSQSSSWYDASRAAS